VLTMVISLFTPHFFTGFVRHGCIVPAIDIDRESSSQARICLNNRSTLRNWLPGEDFLFRDSWGYPYEMEVGQ